jgi:MFS family permease
MDWRYVKKFQQDKETFYIILSSMIMSLAGFMMIILPIYLYLIGFSAFMIGILFSVQMIVGGLVGIPIGHWADKYGKRLMILGGGFAAIPLSLIFVFTTNHYIIFVAAIAWGITGSFLNVFQALLTEKTKEETRNYAFSLSGFGSAIFSSIGFLFAMVPSILVSKGWDVQSSYKITFVLSAVILLAGISIISLVSESKVIPKKEKTTYWPKKSGNVIWKFSVLSLIGLGAGIIIEIFPLWFYLRFHVAGSILGPLFSVSSIALALGFLAGPYLAEKVGNISLIVSTQALSVVLLVLIPLVYSYYIVASLFVSRNFLMNVSGPIESSFMMSVVDPEERASASAIFNAFHSVPRAFGPAIGGYLLNIGDLSGPFFITGTLYSISTAMFYIFFIKYNKKGITN